jgi:hypothetical protein
MFLGGVDPTPTIEALGRKLGKTEVDRGPSSNACARKGWGPWGFFIITYDD